jgi:hypothetical protein
MILVDAQTALEGLSLEMFSSFPFLSLPVLSEHIFNSVNFTNSIKEKWSAPYYDMHALWTPPVHIPPRAPELLPCS